MPAGVWKTNEQYLTSKDRFEEMIYLLKEGKTEDVIGLLEDIIEEMNKNENQ